MNYAMVGRQKGHCIVLWDGHVSSWVYKNVSYRLFPNSPPVNHGADRKVGLQGLGFLWFFCGISFL